MSSVTGALRLCGFSCLSTVHQQIAKPLVAGSLESHCTFACCGQAAADLQVNDDRVLAFPSGFLWGAATAAYQIEGAAAW